MYDCRCCSFFFFFLSLKTKIFIENYVKSHDSVFSKFENFPSPLVYASSLTAKTKFDNN